jgi:transcription initiation factor IIE alpha subunit
MVKMTNLIKNKILEMIQNSDGTTDKDLFKDISKKQPILENEFNKVLLDLEIKGLISVSWLTKDTKRIEYVTIKTEDDEYDKQIKETENKDYEASFPNAD